MQPTMLPKLSETTQTITFTEGEDGCNLTAEVFATDVLVTTSPGSHSHGSSKVKLKSLVDYNWEPRLYSGQLLAVHLSGKYLAYCIKAPNPLNPGTWCGMVRVVYNPEPGTDRRALIKGMKGEVQDLAFAHIQNQVVLACIDEQGNFYVHEIEVTDSGLRCTLLAEVREDTGVGGAAGGIHRVVWCPYIPDEDDAPDDDVARLLLTTHGSVARMWNIGSIARRVAGAGGGAGGGAGSARALAEAGGRAEHGAAVVDAAFSPDGTALATAAQDGLVMFFQVYMNSEGSPRCLHKWQPHGGKPLSCLFFLDNHKNYNSDVQFWKFAVTGADNNTVIKIWSCKSWSCLQTITFTPSLGTEPGTLGLKAMLDTSASYLLLSDFRARSLYVLNMARDKDDTMAYCRSIAEFLLPYPVLSFCIIDAEEEPTTVEGVCESPFHRSGSSASNSGSSRGPEPAARLRLYIVQPKGLQEGELLYTHPLAVHHVDMLNEANNQSSLSFPELSSLTLEDGAGPELGGGIPTSLLQQQSQQLKSLLLRAPPAALLRDEPAAQLNLMTPDAFSSPGKREEEDPPLAGTPEAPGPLEEVTLPSAGSSPSREVQQIMAHNSQLYKPHDMEDEEEETNTPPATTPVEETPSSVVQNGTDTIFPSKDIYVSPEKPQPPKLTHSNSDTSWPQISLAQITEANQRKASSDKSSSQSLNNSLNISTMERANSEEARVSGLSPADKSRLELLEHKLDKLCDLVMQQSRELRALRGEMASPREMIDEALHAHAQRTTAAIESALADGWERVGRGGEAAAARAAAAAGVGAARALEPLAAALQHELAAKLTATDHLLRDNIDKLANSKTMMERLSTSIASSLAGMVRESLSAALVDSVLPLMEKAHAQIFRQINHAFQTGTKEFVSQTEAAARAAAERGGAAGAAALRAALERHAELLQATAAQPPAQASLQATLKEVAHSVLEKELCWWREQARAAVQASRAHSPATPHASHGSVADRQMQVAQIQSLMSAGDINGAFQLALSASDLALVVAACRAAEPGLTFGPPCRLKQHVLLSLVQQLAADMARDTHLKHRYLEEAIMNLDTTNPVTREHLPVVVRELQKQIVAFLNANPSHALTRQFKMLLMATDSLVKTAV